MYALHARNLLNAHDPSARTKVLAELKKKLRDKLPPYGEFEANFAVLSYSKTYTKQKRLIQYVLAKLDRHEGNGVSIDYSQMTIEHLSPQSASVKGSLVGRIGNLILCEKAFNADRLGAKPFAEKKKLLAKSKVTLDSVIREASIWTASEIGARSKAMAKTAFDNVWKMKL